MSRHERRAEGAASRRQARAARRAQGLAIQRAVAKIAKAHGVRASDVVVRFGDDGVDLVTRDGRAIDRLLAVVPPKLELA